MIKQSDAIIVFGTRISVDNKEVFNDILKAKDENNSLFVYMHAIDDKKLENKYTQFIKYEVGSEEGVIALLTSYLVKNSNEKVLEYLEDLDIGYISGESSVGEEELEELVEDFSSKNAKTLVIGNDVLNHSRKENILKFVKLIKEYTDFSVVLLDEDSLDLDESLEEIEEIDTYNGTVIYSINDESFDSLKGSKSFAMAAKIKPNDMVEISYKDKKVIKKFELDEDIKGTVALDSSKELFDDYRFKQVRINKVEG